MEREDTLFPNPETNERDLRSSAERMRRGIRMNATPTEEVLIETINPEQIALEGLDKLILKDPVEDGWSVKL